MNQTNIPQGSETLSTMIAPYTEAIKECAHTPATFSAFRSIFSKSYSHTPPKVNCHPTKQSCQYTAAQSKLSKQAYLNDSSVHRSHKTILAYASKVLNVKEHRLKVILPYSPTPPSNQTQLRVYNTQSPDARHTRPICSCFLSSMARGIARNTLVVKSDCFKSSIRTSDGSIEGLRVIARRV